jgi:hypothetical protein
MDSWKLFLLYNNVLALEDTLMPRIHGPILTKVVNDHGLYKLSCQLHFVEFLLSGQ